MSEKRKAYEAYDDTNEGGYATKAQLAADDAEQRRRAADEERQAAARRAHYAPRAVAAPPYPTPAQLAASMQPDVSVETLMAEIERDPKRVKDVGLAAVMQYRRGRGAYYSTLANIAQGGYTEDELSGPAFQRAWRGPARGEPLVEPDYLYYGEEDERRHRAALQAHFEGMARDDTAAARELEARLKHRFASRKK
jgi:hypothetical protein